MLHVAQEVANPLIPAWYDVIYSIVPVLLVLAMVVGLVSIFRRYRVMSVLESFGWTAVVVFAPLFGPLIWFLVGRTRYEPTAHLGASFQRHTVG